MLLHVMLMLTSTSQMVDPRDPHATGPQIKYKDCPKTILFKRDF